MQNSFVIERQNYNFMNQTIGAFTSAVFTACLRHGTAYVNLFEDADNLLLIPSFPQSSCMASLKWATTSREPCKTRRTSMPLDEAKGR